MPSCTADPSNRFAESSVWQNQLLASDLLQRFSAGDSSTIADLYSEYGGAVFTVCLSILRDHALAADATQETYVKAWRNAETFDPSRDFAPWIYAIARRTAIDLYRQQKRHTFGDGDIDLVEFPPGIEQAWETFEVRLAVDRLPEEERAVVRLTHLTGFSHAEAAHHLDVPIGTIKSRSSRAHQKLARWLSHMTEE